VEIELIARTELGGPDWRSLEMLRARLSSSSPVQPIGYLAGSGFAFLAADASTAGADIKRSIVVLEGIGVVTFDLLTRANGSVSWRSEPAREVLFVQPRHTPSSTVSVLPVDGEVTVLTFTPVRSDLPERIESLDVLGLAVRAWVVLFGTESRSNRSALSFDVSGDGPRQCLVTGLAPGEWDLWRNGWLEAAHTVRPREGAVSFETRPGSYFLRRFS
jgi:Heparinase II C-terminal domain